MNIIYTDEIEKHKPINLDTVIDISPDLDNNRFDIDFKVNYQNNIKTWAFDSKQELIEAFEKVMAHCKATNISKIITL